MAFPRRLLNQGEEVVLDLNPHWIALAPSGLALVATIVLGIVVWAGWNPDPGSLGGKIVYVLVALLILAALVYFLARLAVWRTTHFVVTSTRLIAGHGVLSKTRKEIPLDRVNDVSFQHNLIQRMLGTGTLIVESGGEHGQLVLTSIPRVEYVQNQLYRIVEELTDGDGVRP